MINAIVVDVVGANPIEQASSAFGRINDILEDFINALLELEDIPIINIENFFAKFIKLTSSLLFPELDIIISASFF